MTGEPRVFVIGGGGSGTALYRRLQRRGIPFAAGILPENDVELPTARALAVETVTERAYQPIGEDAYARAQALVRQCGKCGLLSGFVRSGQRKKTACCATGHSRRGCCGANRNWKILHDDRLKCCSKRNVVVK